MPKCFVIQPFDGDKFDRRYSDTFKPALETAGLKPYRVDLDPGVEVTIETIEEEIRNAAICLADISKNNPNVWYELGYAFALNKRVIMICSDERVDVGFPFDIQHRHIIKYNTGSSSDYDELGGKIADRAKALLKRQEIQEVAEVHQAKEKGTLSKPELAVLVIAADEISIPGRSMPFAGLEALSEEAGITRTGLGVAFHRLAERGYLERSTSTDYGWTEELVVLTNSCWEWISSNSSLFRLAK